MENKPAQGGSASDTNASVNSSNTNQQGAGTVVSTAFAGASATGSTTSTPTAPTQSTTTTSSTASPQAGVGSAASTTPTTAGSISSEKTSESTASDPKQASTGATDNAGEQESTKPKIPASGVISASGTAEAQKSALHTGVKKKTIKYPWYQFYKTPEGIQKALMVALLGVSFLIFTYAGYFVGRAAGKASVPPCPEVKCNVPKKVSPTPVPSPVVPVVPVGTDSASLNDGDATPSAEEATSPLTEDPDTDVSPTAPAAVPDPEATESAG